jgi:hypothetical protein
MSSSSGVLTSSPPRSPCLGGDSCLSFSCVPSGDHPLARVPRPVPGRWLWRIGEMVRPSQRLPTSQSGSHTRVQSQSPFTVVTLHPHRPPSTRQRRNGRSLLWREACGSVKHQLPHSISTAQQAHEQPPTQPGLRPGLRRILGIHPSR